MTSWMRAARQACTSSASVAPGRAREARREAPLAQGAAAIRGEMTDSAGSVHGVFGVTHSTQGAGVVARNESGGPDLVLDGEAQGQADTLLSQALERARERIDTDLPNKEARVTAVHKHNGEPCLRCGTRLEHVSFAEYDLVYCPTCQTGGRALADRRMSRLLK